MDNVTLIIIAISVTFAINAVPDKVLSPATKYIVTFLTILFFVFVLLVGSVQRIMELLYYINLESNLIRNSRIR